MYNNNTTSSSSSSSSSSNSSVLRHLQSPYANFDKYACIAMSVERAESNDVWSIDSAGPSVKIAR